MRIVKIEVEEQEKKCIHCNSTIAFHKYDIQKHEEINHLGYGDFERHGTEYIICPVCNKRIVLAEWSR